MRDLDALITVWADDPAALTADERRAVEAALADPGARADADRSRALLRDLREVPAPAAPAWLAASIGEAVDRAVPGRWARLRAWLLPVAAVGAVAAGLGLWMARGGDGASSEAPGGAPGGNPGVAVETGFGATRARAGAPGPDAAPAVQPLFGDEPATAGELVALDDLDDRALDRLAGALGADALDEYADDAVGVAALADRAGDGRGDHKHDAIAMDDRDDAELDAAADVMADPDLDWVDDLSDDDADRLAAWLASHRSPT